MENAFVERILSLAVDIQQIPAPSLAERQRAEYVHQQFLGEGLADVSRDDLDNVYARIPGESTTRSLVISAHLDTVFPVETPLTVSRAPGQIAGPGIGDNAVGVAGLFGLVWALGDAQVQLPGDVWLVANIGEEGLGNLKGMRRVVDRFGKQPLAYIVLEGLAYGRIYHHGLGVRRYRISAHTSGGHSWGDYGTPSAIHELASLVHKLTTRRIPKKPRTTINVGEIGGGLSVNTIAPEAWLMLDLRSESWEQLLSVSHKVESMVQSFQRKDVRFTCEMVGEREAGKIARIHPLVHLVEGVLSGQDCNPELAIGSTDANIPLSRGYPSVCIGLTTGGGAHTPEEFLFTGQLQAGMTQLVEVVRGAFDVL